LKQAYSVVFFLVAAFLVIGCLEQQSGAPTAAPSAGTPAPTEAPILGPGAPGTPPSAPTLGVAASALPSVPSGPKDYQSLVDSGAPYQCDVKVTLDTGTVQYVAKILGKNARVTGTVDVPGAGPTPIDTIVTQTKLYSKLVPGQIPNCDWLKFDISGQAATPGAQNPVDQFKQPTTEFTCNPASFGMEVFAEPAGACDLAALTAGLPSVPG
jgi:hypothetical protein